MGNMFSYLNWRGDLSFAQDGFNEVDNLIFAQLVYVRFEDLKEVDWKQGITIKEVTRIFIKQKKIVRNLKLNEEEKKNEIVIEIPDEISLVERSMKLLYNMAKTERFKDLLLTDFKATFDEELVEQFAAITIQLNKKQLIISFRGTDDSLLGWKEDFNMFFMEHVPAQISAAKYAMDIFTFYHKQMILTGHSKGGNLAIYAAASGISEFGGKLKAVYNNDGPGFSEKMIKKNAYQRILPRMITIVPESSIVGMFLEHQEDYYIVQSMQTGRMQHDATSWEILGNKFIQVGDTTQISKKWDATVSSWLAAMSKEQLKIAVDALFTVLMATEVETRTGLTKDFVKKIPIMFKTMKELDADMRENLTKTAIAFWKETNKTIKTSKKNIEIRKTLVQK